MSCTKPTSPSLSLSLLVAQYLKEEFDPSARCEIFYNALTSYPTHGGIPYAITDANLNEAAERINHASANGSFNKDFKNFEELYDLLHNLLSHIPGINQRVIYSIATHVAAQNKLPLPKDYVYLHGPSLEGFENLVHNHPLPKLSLPTRDSSVPSGVIRLPFADFSTVLQKLDAYQLEDFLYTFKDRL